MTKDEALKLALNIVETHHGEFDYAEEVTAIREALAEPQQEPVGVVGTDIGGIHLMYGTQYVGKTPDKKTAIFFKDVPVGAPLYTSPPAQRKPLTDEEIEQCMKQAYSTAQGRLLEHAFARAIEAAHQIKGDRNEA